MPFVVVVVVLVVLLLLLQLLPLLLLLIRPLNISPKRLVCFSLPIAAPRPVETFHSGEEPQSVVVVPVLAEGRDALIAVREADPYIGYHPFNY